MLWNFHARSRTFSVLHYVIKVTLRYIASRFILPVKTWNFRARLVGNKSQLLNKLLYEVH